MSVQAEKKPFPEERAAKLALAREKALAVRRANKEHKMRAELEKMESARKPKEEYPNIQKLPEESEKSTNSEMIGHTEVDDVEENGLSMDELKLNDEPPPVKEKVVMKVSKGKQKKKEVVIVEQSSDDSDEFESQPNVIFVKRNKKKKEKEPPPPPPPQVTQQPEPPPKPPSPPPPPRLTPEQMQIQQYYHNMFNGVGIAQAGRRRF